MVWQSVKYLLMLFFGISLLMACQDPAQKNTTEKIEIKDTAIRKAPDLDSLLVETKKLREDILQHLDSTTIEGKAAILLARLKDSADYAAIHGRDTLMDLNGDKQADLLLEFYAAAGTGLKNGVNIYMFDKRSNRFVTEPVDLPNPTFNFKNNTVVSYYIAMGAGYATELKWDRLTLDTLESIEVENDWHKPFKSTATIHNHITGKNTRKISDAIWLPAKYRYFDYQPLIRRE